MVKLIRGKEEGEFSEQHAQNILNHPANKKISPSWKLPKDSDWKFTDGELKKKDK
ncbi:MAG: hypothetical protein ACUZ8E_05635 [Candidatus Anammoxibacter sp.]